jgi:hypothetical protein
VHRWLQLRKTYGRVVDPLIDRADEAYLDAKHSDRPEPDSLVQINTPSREPPGHFVGD